MISKREYPADADVVIVGSGPAGAAYARILSERAPRARVLMFEVGPTVSDPPGAHVKNILDLERRQAAQRSSEGPGAGAATITSPAAVKSGQRRARPGTFLLADGYAFPGEDGLPVAAMSSNVGGMGAHWTGACPRPNDSERIDFLPDLDELLEDAERLLGVTNSAFEESAYGPIVRTRLGDAVNEGRPEHTRVQRMPLAVHRRVDGGLVWSGSDVVMGDETRGNARFALFDESLVTRVLTEKGRAIGVEVRDLRADNGGALHTIHARFVVVACDALRTPQLLWASGIRPDALGRYLNDQTQVVLASRIRDAVEAAGGESLGENPAEEPSSGLKAQSGVNWVPFTDELPFHVQVMQLDASPVPLADDDPFVPGSVVGLGLFCQKDLQREDRLVFSEGEADSYGMPAIRVHYRMTERDKATIEHARSEAIRLCRAVGEPLEDDPSPFVMPFGSSLHYQGTTRMGATDDGETVCSPDSEVWAAPGVYVAGNNVIPTPTACNPTLTTVALAIRGARSISRQLADADQGVTA